MTGSHTNVCKFFNFRLALCSSRKYPDSPNRRDWNFLGGGGFVTSKKLKIKCMKLNWNFQRGGGLRKNPFGGGGMDIFWNCTFSQLILYLKS